MKIYIELFIAILRYLLVQITVLVLIVFSRLIYCWIYPLRRKQYNLPNLKRTPKKMFKLFWVFFNDSIDGDYGDPKWQPTQTVWKPKNEKEWYKLSYDWNVKRNPAWNFIGRVINTDGQEISDEKEWFNTNKNISTFVMPARFNHFYGHAFYTFRLNGRLYWAYGYLKKIKIFGKERDLGFRIGHNQFRSVFQLRWELSDNNNIF